MEEFNEDERRKGYALLFASLFSRTSSIAVFKFSQLPVFHVLVGRYLLSLPFLCWFTAKNGLPFWPRRDHLMPIFTSSLAIGVGSILVFQAFSQTTSVASVTIVIKTAMIVGFCLGPKLVGDPWNRNAGIAFVVVLLGLGFVVGELATSIPVILLALAGGCLFSLWDVATRWANKRQVAGEQMVLWQTIVSLFLVIVFLSSSSQAVTWNWRGILAILWIAVVTQVVSFLLYYEAHRHVKNVQLVILLSFFEPVMIAFYDHFLNGTSYTFTFWIGFTLMIVAARLITFSRKEIVNIDPA